jgi:hypothetical protein
MLYFNLWDRVLRTNMPDYAAKVQAIAGRPAPARAPDVQLDGLLQPG